MTINEQHYCMVLGPRDVERGTRAALLQETQWQNGEVIRVRFIGGDPGLRARVRRVAEQWTGAAMANLTFDFIDSGPADIRVAFIPGDGSWSFLGTVCRDIPAAEPTMNFGWLTPASSDTDISEVVLHEFGHALGLIHEHQNPLHAIDWNKDAVIASLSGPPNRWDLATIRRNMFDRRDLDDLSATPVDPLSIMMYPIPASWTNDGFSAGFNTGLSDTDIAFIRTAYPQ